MTVICLSVTGNNISYSTLSYSEHVSGLNLARMLGDKFLKQQDARFSSEPYISEVVRIGQSSKAFAVMAR